MTERPFEEDFNKLIAEVKEHNEDTDVALIEKAFYFAEYHHRGQKRNSGEPYFIHPIAVAMNLAKMNSDDETICAGLMHDVLEDTDVTEDEMREEFGSEITFLVNGVTKLKNLNYKSREEKQAENIRKMVMAMSNDVRVVLIKLADRLHNMRTLEYKTEEKQKEIATETIEIYVPLAHRLGIYSIKWELEDLCFRYLDPQEYYELAEKVHNKRREREAYIKEIIVTLNDLLKDSNINYEISGRPKGLYSIYKKMQRNKIPFEEIYDLTAIRVLVDTVAECYDVLGKVHSKWKPMPNRIKDYIGQPKPNGYKSLHTTVFGNDSKPFEVQIRTRQMHYECEYGIAAHRKYKENKSKSSDFDDQLTFIRQVIEWQQEGGKDVDNKEFLDTLKTDFFSREIYVYSPKGEVYNLPVNSNPIDFAYRIHTEVGNSCVGAKVNGRMVPLTEKLKTGDIVEIVTSSSSPGPSRDRLNEVQSNQAKSKIKQFFKHAGKEQNIEDGRNLLIRDTKKVDRNYKRLFREEWLMDIAKDMGFPSLNELFASIGFGTTTTNQVVQRLIRFYNKELAYEVPIEPKKKSSKKKAHKNDVWVSGLDDIEVNFAKCCNPVPGDKIVGYITKGNGITVHVETCPNIINLKSEDRLVDVYWQEGLHEKFPVKIVIETYDRRNMLMDITAALNAIDTNIQSLNAKGADDGELKIEMTLEVNGLDDLDSLMKKISSMKNVINVYRVKQ